MIDPLSEKALREKARETMEKVGVECGAVHAYTRSIDIIEAALHDVQRETREEVFKNAAMIDLSEPRLQALAKMNPHWLSPDGRLSFLRLLVRDATAKATRDTIQQDADWMQHKPDCAVWMWDAGFQGVSFSQPIINPKQACDCGLASRLQEIQP